jgi:hypothetical protein
VTPPAPAGAQFEFTFGDPVPHTPTPDEVELGVYNENHAPVEVAVTATNRGGTPGPERPFGYWLVTAGGRYFVAGLDPVPGDEEIPPGGAVTGRAVFGPLRMDGPPLRVEVTEGACITCPPGAVIASKDF